MKKIFRGHSPWGFLSFRHVSTENQEPPRYLTGYMPMKKIHKAASVGDITEVQRMLEFGHVDVNITDRKKRTALHYACAHGQSEMVSLLLWYDCNIEARDCEDSTALIKATQRQHEECVRILLDNGADSNAVDTYRNTALHYAVLNNDPAIASKLLAFNADTEIKAKNGYTPLILAVLENKEGMVELLLQAAADINALDNCKRSPLIHAVRAQFKNMISLLLQQGADVSLVDVYGATAQSYTVFETFQVLSKGPSSSHLEPTSEMDEQNFDDKDNCTPCTHPTQDKDRMEQLSAKEEENTDTVDRLESQVALEDQEKDLEICEDCNPKADTCPECYSKTSLAHRPRTPTPTTEDNECSFSSKTPVIQSPMFTESSLWIGYPADWPEPIKFSRQPAVYNPIEWREDMESQSVSLAESKHPASVLLGNAQTHAWPARVSKEPGANDSDPTEKENAKDDLVSLLAPLEEYKPQMKEFSVTEVAKLQTDVKLERQGVLGYEEMGLETCQESSSLEAAESTESCSVLRFSIKPDRSDPESTARKDQCNFNTKVKSFEDKLEKRLLAQRASPHQAPPSPAPLQLQGQAEEPEMNAASDGEDTSGPSRSAEGQVLRGMSLEGEKPEGKDALRLVANKLSQKPGEICEAVKISVHHEEERPRDDCTGKTPLKSASPTPACDRLGCEDRDGAAAPVSVTLQTFPGWEEGGLGDVFPSPSSSQVVGNSGQSVTKFPLMENKLDCENNKSEMEEPLHKSKEKSKTPESGKVDGACPDVCTGEKQGGREFKGQLQNTMKPKRMAWQFEIRHMPKAREHKGLSDFKEKTHVSELKGWGDSTLPDTYKKSKGAWDFTQKPLHSNCEPPPRTVGTARVAPPGGRTASTLADEDLQDSLSNYEFHVLEEEILAWEKVHLQNESVSEDLLNKCEGISSDATDPKRNYLENEDTGEESDFEVTTQSEHKSLDGSKNSQLQKMSEDPKINKKCDGECAPVHPEVPSVRAHEKMSLTQDVTGNNRELQHTAGDVSANICPDKEPLLGSYRGRTQFKLTSKVEEMSKKQWSLELGVSENLCLTVTDYNDNGLIVKRKSGRTKKLLPPEEEDELAKLTKRQAEEKHKMETQVHQVNEMEEASGRSQPSETASGNDSSSLLEFWDMIHSYERLTELKNSHYELLTRKLENMESEANGAQREQTEMKKIKSCLQHKGMEGEELCTLRLPLKQDEKQENAESVFQQQRVRLSRKEEQYGENVEWTQYPEIRTVITDVKAIENDLRQLQGPQDQLSETVQSSEKTHAILQRLEVRLSKLKITLKEQSAKIEQIQTQLLHEGLLGDETKKLIQQTQSLECTLEKQMDKNEELMTELTGFKKLFEETKKKLNKHEDRELSGPGDLKTSQFDMHIPITTLRHELYKLKENWETTYYKYLHMVVKLQFIEQELIAIKTEQKKCGHLLTNHKDLEEEVLHLKSWMRENVTQARDENNTEDLRDTNDVVTISQMELRIKNLESQLATRGAQQSLREGGRLNPSTIMQKRVARRSH
ncbi:LOW QUALITY PROTEIN: ankyrin repeat domain-containing protein 26-like [Peromyscus eremicus]|uniref:LOW QUALITY PROTEIN: ankyrin repeat domain-containing protein 26-like n=1 Tax=Peromyscus eremicus TaxID=42410 RepID=UPI0027DB2D4E|nr:LOW QUALITY PROTEIN: ankyrin repeat domain-containing protein 26-like [Peromyscus eremicus]